MKEFYFDHFGEELEVWFIGNDTAGIEIGNWKLIFSIADSLFLTIFRNYFTSLFCQNSKEDMLSRCRDVALVANWYETDNEQVELLKKTWVCVIARRALSFQLREETKLEWFIKTGIFTNGKVEASFHIKYDRWISLIKSTFNIIK